MILRICFILTFLVSYDKANGNALGELEGFVKDVEELQTDVNDLNLKMDETVLFLEAILKYDFPKDEAVGELKLESEPDTPHDPSEDLTDNTLHLIKNGVDPDVFKKPVDDDKVIRWSEKVISLKEEVQTPIGLHNLFQMNNV